VAGRRGFRSFDKISSAKNIPWEVQGSLEMGMGVGESSREVNWGGVGKEGDTRGYRVPKKAKGGKSLSAEPRHAKRKNGEGLRVEDRAGT